MTLFNITRLNVTWCPKLLENSKGSRYASNLLSSRKQITPKNTLPKMTLPASSLFT